LEWGARKSGRWKAFGEQGGGDHGDLAGSATRSIGGTGGPAVSENSGPPGVPQCTDGTLQKKKKKEIKKKKKKKKKKRKKKIKV